MNSIDVVKEIIKRNDLYEGEFYLLAHKAQVNWRQINNTMFKKIDNTKSGIKFDEYNLIHISGHELLECKDIGHFSSTNNPLVSLTSAFKIQNDMKHIPMMNLHLNEPIEEEKLYNVLSSIIENEFWLIRTDRFYHLYSNYIMSIDDWKEWNLKFLMLDCLVSPRYIGHSLQRNFNLLRQNATDSIKTIIPYVVYHSMQ